MARKDPWADGPVEFDFGQADQPVTVSGAATSGLTFYTGEGPRHLTITAAAGTRVKVAATDGITGEAVDSPAVTNAGLAAVVALLPLPARERSLAVAGLLGDRLAWAALADEYESRGEEAQAEQARKLARG